MAGGRPKGVKYGGRQIGAPNKITGDMRQMLKLVYEERLEDLNRWLKEVAEGFECIHFLSDGTECKYLKRDPARAAELLLRLAEHFVPKLNKTELSTSDGSGIQVAVTINGVVKEEAP